MKLIKYIIKRLLLIIPVVLAISFIVFSILNFTPGDPARTILGANATEENVQKLRGEMGLDKPFVERYFNYVKDAIKGDLGNSYVTGIKVMDEIKLKFPYTLRLAFWGMLFTAMLGVPIGIISAVKQYTAVDSISMVFALVFASMPVFWVSLLLTLIFSVKLKLFPVYGVDRWSCYVLPVTALALTGAAIEARMTRSTMLDALSQDYVRTAKAKGASEKRIIIKHVIRNAMLPVVTIIGMDFGVLLGSTVIVEKVFGIPGIGNLILSSIYVKDFPVVMGGTIIISVCFTLINLIVDLIYTLIDPRIKI